MRDGPSTSLISGLTCSVGLHALLGLAFAVWGDRPPAPRSDSPDASIITYLPPEPPPRIPVPPPPAPPEPVPPPNPELRLGIDDSKVNTPAWLGFAEATEHSAQPADIDQSAMEFEPGVPAPPGPAAPLGQTSPAAAPRPQQTAPAQPPLLPSPNAEPSSAVQPASPAGASKAPELVDTPPANVPADPATDRPTGDEPARAPDGKREGPDSAPRPGATVPPGPDLPRGEQPERDPVAPVPPEQAEPTDQARHQVEIGPLPQGVERPPEARPLEVEPVDRADGLVGPPVPESLQPVDPEASRVSEHVAQPEAPAAEEAPATPAVEPSPPGQASAGAGGNDGRQGEKADRESDASSTKPISVRAISGRVAAGPGIEVRTVKPQWSTTTLLTTTPKNPVVRVTFGGTGKVLEAGFVNGQGTGYSNVDEPLLNAVHSWRASGKKIRELDPRDPKAGITIVFSITLR